MARMTAEQLRAAEKNWRIAVAKVAEAREALTHAAIAGQYAPRENETLLPLCVKALYKAEKSLAQPQADAEKWLAATSEALKRREAKKGEAA